jgi:hypothetical protein|nr:MAG TPA: hypothetical protein [Bacteriophage sp.]
MVDFMEFRTYQQDLEELKTSEEVFNNVISYIYDKTPEEMLAIAKSIKSGANVLPLVKRAFERVLAMRQAERKEVFDFYYRI